MSNHLKAGELYAFAANDGSCIVGKVLGSAGDSVDLYVYDRRFQPLTQKTEVVAALLEHDLPDGYSTNVPRREFALMYPLWLSQQSVLEAEAQSGSQSFISIGGKKIRFKRSRPYWAPVFIFFSTWQLLFIFCLIVCVPNASFPGSLLVTFLFSTCLALPIGGVISFMTLIFRLIESRRTGIPLRTNPTIEFKLPLPFDEAFTQSRDRIGSKTGREFDFVDRRSGYVQTRIHHHLLVRVMCYQISLTETGVIASCCDLNGGAFGKDLWALKNIVALLKAQDGECASEVGQPLLIGKILTRLFWFIMTAVFACVSAMFLKAAIQGEHSCLPLLLLAAVLTGFAGFYLFRPTPGEAVD